LPSAHPTGQDVDEVEQLSRAREPRPPDQTTRTEDFSLYEVRLGLDPERSIGDDAGGDRRERAGGDDAFMEGYVVELGFES
jgi:hypothetical protein